MKKSLCMGVFSTFIFLFVISLLARTSAYEGFLPINTPFPSTVKPSCIVPPPCVYAKGTLQCDIAEPAEGWCPISITPFPSRSPSLLPTRTSTPVVTCTLAQQKLSDYSLQVFDYIATHEANLSSITQKVQTYYQTKLVPAGQNLPSYNALVLAITTKKTALDTAVAKAKTDVHAFTCTENWTNQVTLIKTDLATVFTSYLDYKNAVRNIVVALIPLATTSETSLIPISPSPRVSAWPSRYPSWPGRFGAENGQ